MNVYWLGLGSGSHFIALSSLNNCPIQPDPLWSYYSDFKEGLDIIAAESSCLWTPTGNRPYFLFLFVNINSLIFAFRAFLITFERLILSTVGIAALTSTGWKLSYIFYFDFGSIASCMACKLDSKRFSWLSLDASCLTTLPPRKLISAKFCCTFCIVLVRRLID